MACLRHYTSSKNNRLIAAVFVTERDYVGLTRKIDRLCGLVVRVSGYRYRGPGFDPRRYQIF